MIAFSASEFASSRMSRPKSESLSPFIPNTMIAETYWAAEKSKATQ